jgi:hypothetical protein
MTVADARRKGFQARPKACETIVLKDERQTRKLCVAPIPATPRKPRS